MKQVSRDEISDLIADGKLTLDEARMVATDHLIFGSAYLGHRPETDTYYRLDPNRVDEIAVGRFLTTR